MPVTTFWPPSSEELRALRRRLTAFIAVPTLAIVLGLVVPVIAFTQWRGSFDLRHQLEWTVPLSIGIFLGLGILALIVPRVQVRALGKLIASAPELPLLEPEERLEVLCLGFFLDRRYRLGFLAVTDRRLLRVEATAKGSRQAVLCSRDDLASSELTVRRATRNPLFSLILHSMKTEHGLRLTTRSGQTYFFTSDHFFVEPLQAWLERAGVTTGFRNDADVKERPEMSAVSFTERPIASVRRRTRRQRALVAASVLLAVIANAFTIFRGRSQQTTARLASIPRAVTVNGSLPVLSRERDARKKGGAWSDAEGSDPWPSGPETVVRCFFVTASTPGRAVSAQFELVKIGPDAIVRRAFSEALTEGPTYNLEWERVGPSSDADSVLYDAAVARLRFLAGATLELDGDAALPEIATRRDFGAGERLAPICKIVVQRPTGPTSSEAAYFNLLRDGEKALLRSAQYRGTQRIPCEEVGPASASDEALLQAAVARLKALSKKTGK